MSDLSPDYFSSIGERVNVPMDQEQLVPRLVPEQDPAILFLNRNEGSGEYYSNDETSSEEQKEKNNIQTVPPEKERLKKATYSQQIIQRRQITEPLDGKSFKQLAKNRQRINNTYYKKTPTDSVNNNTIKQSIISPSEKPDRLKTEKDQVTTKEASSEKNERTSVDPVKTDRYKIIEPSKMQIQDEEHILRQNKRHRGSSDRLGIESSEPLNSQSGKRIKNESDGKSLVIKPIRQIDPPQRKIHHRHLKANKQPKLTIGKIVVEVASSQSKMDKPKRKQSKTSIQKVDPPRLQIYDRSKFGLGQR